MNTLGNFFKSKINIFVTVGIVFHCQYFFNISTLDLLGIFFTPTIINNHELDVFCEFDFQCSDNLAEFL